MSKEEFIQKMIELYGWTKQAGEQQFNLFEAGVRDHNLHDNTCYYLVTYD